MLFKLVFLLLIVYQIKHFLADYPLQGRYMLGKFKPGWDFLGPLATHCSIHALFTFLIYLWVLGTDKSICYGFAAFGAFMDFTCHFVMDRIKASPRYLGRFKPLSANEMKNILSYLPTLGEEEVKEKFGKELRSNTYFWWSLGLDQMIHHLTHYWLIWFLIGAMFFTQMGLQ